MNYWKSNPRKALYASQINVNQQLLSKCGLSPRSCLIPEGKFGFCGVRGTVDGSLQTVNYGQQDQEQGQKYHSEPDMFHIM